MAVSNNFWEPGWTTSAIDDMKSGGLRQFGIHAKIKHFMATDARLDDTRVEVTTNSDLLRTEGVSDESLISIRMKAQLVQQVRSQTPACAECGSVKAETTLSFNPRDMTQMITVSARCTQNRGKFPSLECPKRASLKADESAAAWPPVQEIPDPIIEQSPDVPQNYADAW